MPSAAQSSGHHAPGLGCDDEVLGAR